MVQSIGLAMAAGLMVVASALPAVADSCDTPVGGAGRAAHPQNFDPPKKYDVGTKAERNAIAAWRVTVQQSCPGASPIWWAARDRHVVCESYAGGVACEASAIPARR